MKIQLYEYQTYLKTIDNSDRFCVFVRENIKEK